MPNEQKRQGARVSFSAIERRFQGTGQVIDKVSLNVEPGEFVAILGPSGCGKSTFLRMAADLDRPDAGQIQIDNFGRKDFRGFVFQDAHLLPWRTLLDNVVLPLQLTGKPIEQAREDAKQVLEKVHLADALGKYPAQLSGGMRMRAAVARALVTKPSLLLMDEPFAALDENTRHRLQEELRLLWETLPMTVLFVTHSVSEAVFLANRAVVLSSRPAKISLDLKLELPSKRTQELRTSNEFNSQMRKVYEAFEMGLRKGSA